MFLQFFIFWHWPSAVSRQHRRS